MTEEKRSRGRMDKRQGSLLFLEKKTFVYSGEKGFLGLGEGSEFIT